METYVFRWPYDANEVFVTGTFDDWGKTVRLEPTDHGFEKEVSLPLSEEKILYKFVVDGSWTIDPDAPREDDGDSNTNNVLGPGQLRPPRKPEGSDTAAIAVMAGVTPDSTTAALAAKVPKESQDPGANFVSSVGPDSTTTGLANDVPLEESKEVPGTFPGTPAKEPEQFSVNPIPATNGIGNPIHLAPGEKVPDPSEFTSHTIQSTVTTDKEGYDRDASNPVVSGLGEDATEPGQAFVLPPVSRTMIPESSLPMDPPDMDTTDPGVTIQSVSPDATTAALAASVPLEPRRQTNGASPADEVPDVVKQSIDEAHETSEATANAEAVEEKKEVEDELLKKVVPAESAASASRVPPVVEHSLAEAHQDPEATANPEAVEEKHDVEEELQQKIKLVESSGEPAPTITAAPTENPVDSADISPKTSMPAPSQPTYATGVSDAQTAEVDQKDATAPEVESTAGSGRKRRHRISILLHKLKEKIKEL